MNACAPVTKVLLSTFRHLGFVMSATHTTEPSGPLFQTHFKVKSQAVCTFPQNAYYLLELTIFHFSFDIKFKYSEIHSL